VSDRAAVSPPAPPPQPSTPAVTRSETVAANLRLAPDTLR
jgi:hypothetical protein